MLVNAYAAHMDRRTGWDFEDETPGNDARGFAREGAMPPMVETHLANTVLTNGARYYVDHAHPEYSTPECVDPLELVLHDKAGEEVLRRAMAAAAVMMPDTPTPVVYKNNSDKKGNSYGCHENYLMDRAVPFARVVSGVVPHFVTRQLYAGAGKVGVETTALDPDQVEFQISQRAEFFEEVVGLETTLKRPIVNTRDEPHADPRRFRRLHVIVGDANLLGGGDAAQDRHDGDRARHDRGRRLAGARPDAQRSGPGDAPGLGRPDLAPTARTGGRHHGERHRHPVGALHRRPALLQGTWARRARRRGGGRLGPRPLGGRAPRPRDRSQQPGAPARLGGQARDHARPIRDRHGCSWDDNRLAALDLQYHDLRPERSLYGRLGMERLVDDQAVAAAVTQPPRSTRAWFRGTCLARWPDEVVTANWDSLVFDLGTDPLRRVPMMDPLKGTAEHTAALLESSASPAELLERLSS